MILLIRQSGTEDRIGHLEKQAMDHNRFKFQVLSSPLKFIRANLHHNNVNKNVEMSYVLANSFIIILKKKCCTSEFAIPLVQQMGLTLLHDG